VIYFVIYCAVVSLFGSKVKINDKHSVLSIKIGNAKLYNDNYGVTYKLDLKPEYKKVYKDYLKTKLNNSKSNNSGSL
jgi:hypothetical protein